MPNKFYSPFEHKMSSPGPAKSGRTGPSARWSGKEQTAAWPAVKPERKGGGFNRATKFDVVKTRARKSGID